jgi:Heparinase II/III-like protein/Heparinase II/III N-terminus
MIPVLARLRGRSVGELRERAAQALHARLERFGDALLPRLVHRRGRAPSARIFDRGIEALASAPGSVFDPASIASAVARHDPQLHARFIEQSDAAEHGRVALLGHGLLAVGNPPCWQREPVSGTEAPRVHWSRIDHLDTSAVGDHKVLWELNRHQYLLAPAFCWLLDREPRRFDLIAGHLEAWLAENPPNRGVNWVSSLELSLRAIAWCWLLWMLREAPWREGLQTRLALSLEAHGRHIERYLSTYYSPNTHLTGEALGLFYVGTVLPDTPGAANWRSKGASILESAIVRQVFPDGVYFEQASQYQRYTAEIYLHYLLLADATGWSVSGTVRERLGDLLAVLRTLASSRGRIPLLGDDDGGLLLPFDHRPPDDVSALLLAGAAALGRAELRAAGDASPSFAYWLCGIERTDRLRARRAANPQWQDVYFARGGLAVLRDGWDADAPVAVIDAGPHGGLSCGHSHADALAMTLDLGAQELFIDRGTLTYSGPERNEFRATVSHNTLEIDGAPSVSPGEPFKWLSAIPEPARGRVCSSAEFSSFFGTAVGHLAGGRPSTHCRQVLHRKGGAWVIRDRAVRAGARAGVLRWQLAPHLTATAVTPRRIEVGNDAGRAIATIYLRGASAVRIVMRDVSPRHGQRIVAPCLELETGAALEALTIVVPAAADGSPVGFEAEGSSPEGDVVWTDQTGRNRVLGRAWTNGPQPLAMLGPDTSLSWWAEGTAGPDGDGSLLAALSVPETGIPGVAQAIADGDGKSGRMELWMRISGSWTALSVGEPRRG